MVGQGRVRAYIGLGANLGQPEATLARAVAAIDRLPATRVRAVSRLYATVPWGVVDQPEFRNAVVAIDTRLEPMALLGELKRLEAAAGRVAGKRWGPRLLDLDLLVHGRARLAMERRAEARSLDAAGDPAKAARWLEVPHRDLGRRLFVLAPMADLAPGLVPPGWDQTIATRRRLVASSEPPDSVRAVARWDAGPEGSWVSLD